MEVPEELLNRYLERRKKDLENCSFWVKEGSFQNVERTGHQLKGNGETFGFGELSELGAILEEAAKKKDISKLHSILHDFDDWLKKRVS
jgi:HPt (histidine-containing phosphotransfer) domain-containing protein